MCKVDWGEGADTINYLQVASNTRVVGAEVARSVKSGLKYIYILRSLFTITFKLKIRMNRVSSLLFS